MSHTKEPWILRSGNEIGVADKSDTQSYGMLNVIARADKYDFENWQENARRIVACVNACAGIGTETIEKIGRLNISALNEYEIIEKERDTYRELCGELKLKLSSIESNLMVLPERYAEEWKNNVMHLWVCARNNDSRIPDDVLDFMRDMLLSAPRMNGENNAT